MDEKLCVEIWKKVIDVQQHFNDIQMRVRSIVITLVTAVIAASGYTLEKQWIIRFGDSSIAVAALVLLAGTIAVVMFWAMDLWYHRYLRGAVSQGMFIEDKWKASMPELGLSKRITEYSHEPIVNLKLTSKSRLNVFYIAFIVVLMILIFTVANIDF